MCEICVQGILLDEASGVSRTQQPVMPAGYQPPKIVVSSWNRRVSFSTWGERVVELDRMFWACHWHDGSFSCPYREESAGMRPFTFYMLKTFSGHSSSSRRKWITATLLLSPKFSSNPMRLNLCHHVSVERASVTTSLYYFHSLCGLLFANIYIANI